MTITVDVDLRGQFAGARDQGLRPTCLVFAVSAAHEAKRESRDYLSTEYLFYSGVQRTHQDPHKGLTRDAVRDALQNDGQPPETIWPYASTPPHAKNWKPPTLADTPHKATIEYEVRSVTQICALIRTGKPVVLITTLTIALHTPDNDAIVRRRTGDVAVPGRHAVVAVGVGHAEDGDYILVRNSWGTRWGQSGYGWIHGPYLESQLQMTGIILDEKTS